MAGIPLDKAELLALLLETIVYGIFLGCFILVVVMSFQVEKDLRMPNQRFILPVGALMVLLSTAHLTIDFVRALEAFTTGDVNKTASPIKYYGFIGHPLHVTKTIVYSFQTALGDSVLVWRCYIVWNKTLWVLVPGVIATLATFSLGIVAAWSVTVTTPGSNIFNTAVQYITSFFAITMSVNMSCSAAIAFKIWMSRRSLPSTPSGIGLNVGPIIAAIIESGAIYSASVLSTLIAYLCGSNGQYAALDLVTPLVGVVYCLIILQIHFHFRVSRALKKGATSHWSLPLSWRRNATQRDSTELESQVILKSRPQQVTVHITEQVEAHIDPQSSKARFE